MALGLGADGGHGAHGLVAPVLFETSAAAELQVDDHRQLDNLGGLALQLIREATDVTELPVEAGFVAVVDEAGVTSAWHDGVFLLLHGCALCTRESTVNRRAQDMTGQAGGTSNCHPLPPAVQSCHAILASSDTEGTGLGDTKELEAAFKALQEGDGLNAEKLGDHEYTWLLDLLMTPVDLEKPTTGRGVSA